MPEPLSLHPDRFFDPDPDLRGHARAVYEATATLPIVSPHGHVDPALLARDEPFPEPTGLLIAPDHYIFRMLRSQGVGLDELGIPRRDGSRADVGPRAVWRLFCARYGLFAGTPTRAWLDYELHELFGIRERPEAANADRLYDHVAERLSSPEYRPRALYRRFNIELLCTTDAASDTLEHHDALRASGWVGDVRPCFRPDAVMRIAAPGWQDEIARLERACGFLIGSYADFVRALQDRRTYFRARGAFATDHAVVAPHTERLDDDEAERLFSRALDGQATAADQCRFEAHFLMEMARMSGEDGLVMQLHAGSLRDHDVALAERFGPDKGADVPVATEWTRSLRALLNAYGADARFRLILFTLDESTYSRELAPLAGYYPAVLLGPPWWFHDSIEGMLRFRERTTETAGFYNTAGFNDDTRAFPSIPARHDLARRVDAVYLARLVARHQISLAEAFTLGRALAYDLPRRAYKLDAPASAG